MWNKEIKIFKDLDYMQLPDYKFNSSKQYSSSPHKGGAKPSYNSYNIAALQLSDSSPKSSVFNIYNTKVIAERTNAQSIELDFENTVSDILSSVSFSPDVLEDRIPELLPYYSETLKELFKIPPGLRRSAYPRKFKDVRISPVSHLPCILKDCTKRQRHSHEQGSRSSNRSGPTNTSLQRTSVSCPTLAATAGKKTSTSHKTFEDEKFLSNVSPSTVELIISKMTCGLQQERLRRKFNISTTVRPNRDF